MTVALSVNGDSYEGFESGSVQLTMEEAANSFQVEYVADGRAIGARVVFPGDECVLSLDDDVVIEGYVDTVDDEDQADTLRLRAAGRSRAADLIDCAAVASPGSWINMPIDVIASDLCDDFGIGCYIDGDPGAPFASFAIQKGESAFDALSRAAIKRGFYIYSVAGDVVLSRAGSTRTTTVLERGKNLISSARSDSWYSRFSEYIFRGQARATDGRWGKSAAHLKSVVTDPAITRFRPTIVQAEAHDGIDLLTRATLERNQRAGQGERILCVVDGWLTDEGKAWRPNTLARFKNPVLGVDATLLVVVARFRLGAKQPKETELELTRPEAFDVAHYPALGRGESWTS
jgi:prophage tail gpP-like protein